jgi:hypothetical protein
MTTKVFWLWALATALLIPLTMAQHGPLLQSAGMGVIGAAVGAAFLYAGRARPYPMRRAALAVIVFCALLWLGPPHSLTLPPVGKYCGSVHRV